MNKIVILNNKKCQILSEDEILLKKLHRYLSYKLSGVEYTAAYQNGWNGINYLLSKTGKFNIGLLEKVKVFLKNSGFQYLVEDQRSAKIINSELNISENLEKYGLIPRDHQRKICDLVNVYDRGIIRAATGAGKTLAIALITAKINKPTVIYVIGLDLLDQFHKLFSKLFNEKIGYIGNGICDPARITIASIWTIGRALNIGEITEEDEETEEELDQSNYQKIISVLEVAKLHVLDESHIVVANTISEIYKAIDPEYIYGFSGTPFRDDGSDLQINGILGEQIIDISASELIKLNLLAKPIIKFVSVPKLGQAGSNYQQVYKNYIVENEVRNNLIVKNIGKLLEKGYTPLVLFKQIKHGNILAEKLEEAGVRFGLLSGRDSLDKRNLIKDELNSGKINLVLASTIFDIGLDLPKLSALVLCGSGKSSVRTLQRLGRILRNYPGKSHVAVIDFFDQAKFVKKHSLTRYKIYQSEPGFEIVPSREMHFE